MHFFLSTLIAGIRAYESLIFIRCLLSWFRAPVRSNVLLDFLYTVTDPVMKPFRRVFPAAGGLDFSPILVFLALELVVRILQRLLHQL